MVVLSLLPVYLCLFLFSVQMYVSAHYAGADLVPKVRGGEYWKKVFGPVFMYVNSSWLSTDPQLLWEDAKIQVVRSSYRNIEIQCFFWLFFH